MQKLSKKPKTTILLLDFDFFIIKSLIMLIKLLKQKQSCKIKNANKQNKNKKTLFFI